MARCVPCEGTGRIPQALDPPPWDGAYRLVKCEACDGVGAVADAATTPMNQWAQNQLTVAPYCERAIAASPKRVPQESHDADGRLIIDWRP